jgi:hypothetical protein
MGSPFKPCEIITVVGQCQVPAKNPQKNMMYFFGGNINSAFFENLIVA